MVKIGNFFKGSFFFFDVDHFLKSSLNFSQYCLCFMFWFFDHEACGVVAHWPGIEPTTPALEDKVLTTGSLGNVPDSEFYVMYILVALVMKNPTANEGDTRDPGLISGSGRSWRKEGSPLQYSWLENPMDRGTWSVTVHGVTKSQTPLKPLSTHTCFIIIRKLKNPF